MASTATEPTAAPHDRSSALTPGFVDEHRRNAERWDLAAIVRELRDTVAFHLAGSDQDPFEPDRSSPRASGSRRSGSTSSGSRVVI